jgi:protein-tyrosine-phosphatase
VTAVGVDDAPPRSVLFVCTGNIFRSLTAEYALRRALPGSPIVVHSAGTEDYPHVVARVVRDYLLEIGLDVGAHARRTLTAEMLAQPAQLVVAMSVEHQRALALAFGFRAPLYSEVCGVGHEPLPDVEEAVADHRENPAAVAAHVRATIDRIVALAPRLAARLARTPG